LKVLVVGSGGREHAIVWALSRDPEVKQVYAAPGNPGIGEIAKTVPVNAMDIEKLASFATNQEVDLTVIGPEAPLQAGIVDHFQKNKLRIFGPDQTAAKIETSKSFAKDLCFRSNIPASHSESFTNVTSAISALDRLGPPWVVKADGLAAGKGTTVTVDRREAEEAIRRELQRKSSRIVIEKFIDGWEASFLATVSANRIQWLMPVLQDYKPIFDNDIGPNTGGMGVSTPVPYVTKSLVENVRERILSRLLKALAEVNMRFQGVVYLNAIIPHGTEDPYVLEFNARFGDPEAQGIMPLVKSGLAAHLSAIADNSKTTSLPEVSDSASVVVVLASKGYPSNPSLGDKITIKELSRNQVSVFHAGTAIGPNGTLVTSGGRVLNIVATGHDVESARNYTYSAIKNSIFFQGMQFRTDIGLSQVRKRKLTRME
jgi:phosphoribosylamine--glycine ligase